MSHQPKAWSLAMALDVLLVTMLALDETDCGLEREAADYLVGRKATARLLAIRLVAMPRVGQLALTDEGRAEARKVAARLAGWPS